MATKRETKAITAARTVSAFMAGEGNVVTYTDANAALKAMNLDTERETVARSLLRTVAKLRKLETAAGGIDPLVAAIASAWEPDAILTAQRNRDNVHRK